MHAPLMGTHSELRPVLLVRERVQAHPHHLIQPAAQQASQPQAAAAQVAPPPLPFHDGGTAQASQVEEPPVLGIPRGMGSRRAWQ